MFFSHHIVQEFVIQNELGLHARPATIFVQTALKYESTIKVTNLDTEKVADGKSVLEMLFLASPKGSRILVEIDGSDAKQAMSAIQELVENKFGEEE